MRGFCRGTIRVAVGTLQLQPGKPLRYHFYIKAALVMILA